jgi:putative MATE family efflux protein
MLAVSLPFSTLMFVGGSCLRGGGDTVTPAIAMIVVDIVNIFFTFTLCFGWLGLPKMGFNGIALGTILAYVAGGVIIFVALLRGGERGAVRLRLHRMRLHWHTMKRLLKVGLPSGTEGLISWIANFGVVIIINGIDRTNAAAAAHINAIRIESLSFMTGLAVATACATMVGQSLGAKDPQRARRSAFLGYAVGGGAMILMGVLFMVFSHQFARLLSDDPTIEHLTATCLFITGIIQGGFALGLIFGGSLRGAGDTLAVMLLCMASVVFVRLVGVLIVGYWLHMGLAAIWVVLAIEQCTRGLAVFGRFLQGGWKKIEV